MSRVFAEKGQGGFGRIHLKKRKEKKIKERKERKQRNKRKFIENFDHATRSKFFSRKRSRASPSPSIGATRPKTKNWRALSNAAEFFPVGFCQKRGGSKSSRGGEFPKKEKIGRVKREFFPDFQKSKIFPTVLAVAR